MSASPIRVVLWLLAALIWAGACLPDRPRCWDGACRREEAGPGHEDARGDVTDEGIDGAAGSADVPDVGVTVDAPVSDVGPGVDAGAVDLPVVDGVIGDGGAPRDDGAMVGDGSRGVDVATGLMQLALGEGHSCVRFLDDGAVYCWGRSEEGQISGLMMTNQDGIVDPTRLRTDAGPISAAMISAGRDHTCVLHQGGGVECWGTIARCTGGTRCHFDAGVLELVSGGTHACVLLDGGTAQCWGDNTVYQLGGDGGAASSSEPPRPVPDLDGGVLTGIVDLSANHTFTCARRTAGASDELWCWGDNFTHRILVPPSGNIVVVPLPDGGSVEAVPLPHRVSLPPGRLRQFVMGERHLCAVMVDDGGMDRTHCWDENQKAQWGNGTPPGGGSASQMGFPHVLVARDAGGDGALRGVTRLAAGDGHICALAGGDVYCWGNNDVGQIRGGTDAGGSSPLASRVAFPDGGPFLEIASYRAHTCALRGNGELYCWGWNVRNQLGNGPGDPYGPRRVEFRDRDR